MEKMLLRLHELEIARAVLLKEISRIAASAEYYDRETVERGLDRHYKRLEEDGDIIREKIVEFLKVEKSS